MRPGEISDNVGPSWQPQVWTKGPDQLVAEARNAIFAYDDSVSGALGSGAPDAHAGLEQPTDADPWEGKPPGTTYGQVFMNDLQNLRKKDPAGERSPSLPWSAMEEAPNPPVI